MNNTLCQHNKNSLITLTLLSLVFVQGCGSLQKTHISQNAQKSSIQYQEQQNFFSTLDKAIRRANTADTSLIRVPGFPYLRTNRFLIGLKEQAATEDQLQLWVEKMRQLDLQTREKEIDNLPESAIEEFLGSLEATTLTKARLKEKLAASSQKLFRMDQQQPEFYEQVKKSVQDPGEYSFAMRFFGGYPLFSLPVIRGTKNSHKKFIKWLTASPESFAFKGTPVIYSPEKRIAPQEIQYLLKKTERNVLGVPELDKSDIEQLAWAFAPIFQQDVLADYDELGEVIWKDHTVTIGDQPTVYYYLTYAFIKGEPVLQLNYAIWYLGRFGPHAPLIERGALDGLTVRITLDKTGDPIMTDIMNSCGCYHFFVPRKDRIERVITGEETIDPSVPIWLPESFPQKRLTLTINTGWHQVQRLYASAIPTDAVGYQLLPYDILESLPHGDGRTESVFNRHGIMKDSSRIEPLIFFAMGIHDIGYMRQRGRHPIKLVGRAHFTDPDLFDRNFIFQSAPIKVRSTTSGR